MPTGGTKAPKCLHPECKNTTKRTTRRERQRYQIGDDGKAYTPYCSGTCAKSVNGRLRTPAKDAAVRRAMLASKKKQRQASVREICDAVREYVDENKVVNCHVNDLVKAIWSWGAKRDRAGYWRGHRAARAEMARQ